MHDPAKDTIALHCTSLDWGGTEGDAVELACGYKRRGLSPVIIVDHGPMHRLPVLKAAGVPVIVLDAEPNWTDQIYKSALREALFVNKARIIHVNAWERLGAIFQTGNALRIPVLVTIHWTVEQSLRFRLGIVGNPIEYWRTYFAYARENPVVINISDLSERNFKLRYPQVRRSRRVYLGCRIPEQAVDPSIADNAPQVLWVGSMIKRKRPLLAIEIWRSVIKKYPKSRLFMVGSGPLMPEVEAAAAKLPDGSVHVAGNVMDMTSSLENSQILWHTATREGIPVIILQALTYGIPVVSTDAGAISEAVIHEKQGLVSPVQDVQALEDNLCRLIADPALRGTMGYAARQRGCELFDVERHIDETLRAYNDFCETSFPLSA